MRIELKKLTNDSHQLRCVRADDSEEVAELETKSFFVHDFTHLAYEIEAGLIKSFWGSVASGEPFTSLRADDRSDFSSPDTSELVQTEMIVGPLQGVTDGGRTAKELIAALENQFSAYGSELPAFFDEAFVDRCKARYDRFIGQWNKLPFGETMIIEWNDV